MSWVTPFDLTSESLLQSVDSVAIWFQAYEASAKAHLKTNTQIRM
jgi:hypothetical protein